MAGEPSPLLHDPGSLDVLCRRGPSLLDPAGPGFYNSRALYQSARLSARLTPLVGAPCPNPVGAASEAAHLLGSHSLIDPTTLTLGENQHRLTKLDLVPLLQWIRLVFRYQLSIDFSAISTTFILQAKVPISHVYNGSMET